MENTSAKEEMTFRNNKSFDNLVEEIGLAPLRPDEPATLLEKNLNQPGESDGISDSNLDENYDSIGKRSDTFNGMLDDEAFNDP